MRCVLVCPPGAGFPRAVTARGPALLLPLLDRPFLQHVIERLVGLGVRDLDLLAAEHPEAIDDLVGDGSRWGCRARVHLVRDGAHPYQRLRLAGEDGAGVLLVHGDRLPGPALDLGVLAEASAPVLLQHDEGGRDRWTGWAWLPAGVASLVPEDLDEVGLEAFLRGVPRSSSRAVERVLEATTVGSVLTANRAVMDGVFPGLLLTGREVEPGVWLSRNVVLHPRARVTPPVHLCENVRIGAGTQVGPYAVIGRDSILDERCHVESAVVAPGSYVGEALDLVGVFVDRNLLVNVEHGVATTVTDRFILGSLTPSRAVGWGVALVHRAIALLLLLLGWPLLVGALLGRAYSRRATIWHTLDAVVLPAEPDEATWRTVHLRALAPLDVLASRASLADLVLRVLPLLPAVIRGRLGLVGVPPRDLESFRELPDDWRDLLLGAPLGVLWESHVVNAHSDDERRAAETYYAAVASLRHDLAIVAGYLRRVLCGAGGGPARSPRAGEPS